MRREVGGMGAGDHLLPLGGFKLSASAAAVLTQ
jgi:hypothetical protein